MVLGTTLADADTVVAAARTWGIPGPVFLCLYALAGILAVGYGVAARMRITRASSRAPIAADALTLAETAMLVDDHRPVLTGLMQLRGRQLINSNAIPVRTPDPAEDLTLEPISRSLLAYLFSSGRRHVMALTGATFWQVRSMRDSLVTRGYLIGPQQRKGFFLAALPSASLLILGLVHLRMDISNDQPIGILILLMIVLLICVCRIVRNQRLTHRGLLAAADARSRYSHLSPHLRPAYTAYGPDSAAMAIALFGPRVLWELDLVLARLTLGFVPTPRPRGRGPRGSGGSRGRSGGRGSSGYRGSSFGGGGFDSYSSGSGSGGSSCGCSSSCSGSSCSSSSSSCSSSSSSCSSGSSSSSCSSSSSSCGS
ncbi:TIGR04222 domain-containing membrane protein [Nocardia sp. NPDC051030]|uniref:TIGR04222 domain-containing membrane protein n=1 Tax=Nocardia sp. NPDC051030 TaxID=3155162 RepID=UPI00342CDDE0